jgi:16S rRNA (guanine527-N7)-methyltransferase
MAENPSFSECEELFRKYEIPLTEDQYRKFCRYADMMVDEKRHQNITAIREQREIWVRHFLDSAYISLYMPQFGRLLDIGTGGGIPGIPLAILNPEYEVTLLDSEINKIRFCQEVVFELGLNCTPVSTRAEEYSRLLPVRESFDIVTSRAMASGSMLLELSLPFVKRKGLFLALKGRNFDEEREAIERVSPVLGGSKPDFVHYEIEGEEKNLVLIDKPDLTPFSYPRRFAKIKRKPL